MVEEKNQQIEFYILTILTVLILIGGMFFYHNLENWSYLDSLYFSVVSLTTVGYGDLSPTTNAGKIFTMGYIFVGIGIILAFINALLKSRVEKRFFDVEKRVISIRDRLRPKK